MRRRGLISIAALIAAGGLPTSAMAQDYNYVPGWATTTNHEYKGENDGEWEAKTELFDQLRQADPVAECTLSNLSEAEGNVIVNQFRSHERRTSTAAAFQRAQRQVEEHHRRLRAEGKC
jgi:hypothetical protein